MKSLYNNVLEVASRADASASIASVATRSGGTLVRVHCTARENASRVVSELRRRWPLATGAVVENELVGGVDAQLLLPDESECAIRASRSAQADTRVAVLKKVVYALCGVLFVVVATSVLRI